jgi:hypothetical protein
MLTVRGIWRLFKGKAVLYTYENIKLRVYMEIAATGNLQLMIVKGVCDMDKCYDAYEDIIKRNYEIAGNYSFDNALDLKKTYAMLMADYIAVKAALTILLFQIDDDLIQWLGEKGYRVETELTDAERKAGRKVSEKYETSITRCMRVSESINTRLKTKHLELEEMSEDNEGAMGFEEIIASISAMLGFQVDKEITLAGFNQYQEIIKKRNQPQRVTEYVGD